jgi:hypothetical protein
MLYFPTFAGGLQTVFEAVRLSCWKEDLNCIDSLYRSSYISSTEKQYRRNQKGIEQEAHHEMDRDVSYRV